MLYECATGQPPFASDDLGELLRMHAAVAPRDPRTLRPDLPAPLGTIIGRLLAKDPDDRYQSARGLVSDLRLLAEQPTLAELTPGADDGPSRPHDTPLIGRDGELAGLRDQWSRVRVGDGEMALLQGKCNRDDPVPLAPLRAAVDQHVQRVEGLPAAERDRAVARLRTAAGPMARLLVRLSPDLGALLDVPALAAEGQHEQCIVATAEFLIGLAGDGAAVLYLDDVQWLDETPRQVLYRVGSQLTGTRLLVLMTSRDDVDSRPALEELRRGLGSALGPPMTITPLDAGAVAGIVASVTGGTTIGAEAAAMLAARVGGNPFALLQYIVTMIDSGLVRPLWGEWVLDNERLEQLPLPGSAVDLVVQRLDAVDPDSRRLLGVGALTGARFTTDLVADVCRVDRREVRDVLVPAVWQRLVQQPTDGQYSFVHDCVREALLTQFDEATVRRLHQRVADVLEQAVSGEQGLRELGHPLPTNPLNVRDRTDTVTYQHHLDQRIDPRPDATPTMG